VRAELCDALSHDFAGVLTVLLILVLAAGGVVFF
jgi:hypothetical protein